MSRRSVSSILVFGLLLVLFVVAIFVPVPYVTMSPGPTVNVLGETAGKSIVAVQGQRVTTPAEVVAAVNLAKKAGRSSVLLLVKRGTAPEAFVGIDITGD